LIARESTGRSFAIEGGMQGETLDSLRDANPRPQARPITSTSVRAPWRHRALTLIGVMTALRFAGIACTALTDTEGYYVSWSRFLDWSYYDHPPMVAWMTWASTRISDSAVAARVGPVLCAALAEVLLFHLACRFFSTRAAFFAVALHVAIPAYFFTALLVNPEATLAPSWLLALVLLDDLRRHDEPWRPLVLGAAIGIAFLSKYTALLRVPVTLLVVITIPSARKWLQRPSFYAGGLVALMIASPVIVWNASRGWPSLQLHLAERVAPPTIANMIHYGSAAAVGQLVLFHPMVFPLLMVSLVVLAVRARRDVRYRFLACASVPVLVFFAFTMSRVSDAEPHWTMVGLLPVIVGAGAMLEEQLVRMPRATLAYATAGTIATMILTASTFVHALTPTFEERLPVMLYDGHDDAVHETLGWDELRSAVAHEARVLGPRAVVASAHNVFCGHLLVELDDRPRVYCPSPRRTQLDFEGRGRPPLDVPVLFVHAARDPERHDEAMEGRDCTLVRRLRIERGGDEAARYDLLACPAMIAPDFGAATYAESP
jgi:4-amino-4-deoxy-L-arabinose transferase-like glycosyltransferase